MFVDTSVKPTRWSSDAERLLVHIYRKCTKKYFDYLDLKLLVCENL